jgi:hypothetical protein
MLDKVLSLLPNRRSRGVAMMVGGMLGLLTGSKIPSLIMVARGAKGLEDEWREQHPEFQGTLAERWQKAIEFYEATHKEPTNRRLHVIGIPIIVGGTAGLLLFSPFRPMWFVSAGAFVTGWVMNFIGHGLYEKNKPAFADDPLSFLAGPAWDLMQVFGKGKRNGVSEESPGFPTTVGEPARA